MLKFNKRQYLQRRRTLEYALSSRLFLEEIHTHTQREEEICHRSLYSDFRHTLLHAFSHNWIGLERIVLPEAFMRQNEASDFWLTLCALPCLLPFLYAKIPCLSNYLHTHGDFFSAPNLPCNRDVALEEKILNCSFFNLGDFLSNKDNVFHPNGESPPWNWHA